FFVIMLSSLSCSSFLHVSFSFFLLLSLPSSTLFPYTTLFRSGCPLVPLLYAYQICIIGLWPLSSTRRRPRRTCASTGLASAFSGDRKSTRLNSSHGSISYAVFCLKKKTKINNKNMHITVRYKN